MPWIKPSSAMLSFLEESLIHQEKVQQHLLGSDWRRDPRVSSDRIVIAQLDELMEMANAISYKWWTSQEPSYRMALLELVDFWHFYLIDMLYHQTKPYIARPVCEAYIKRREPLHLIIRTAEAVLRWHYVAIPALTETLISVLGFKLSDFTELYFSKAQLNVERKNKGYDTDVSKKFLADGREDNEELLQQFFSRRTNDERQNDY